MSDTRIVLLDFVTHGQCPSVSAVPPRESAFALCHWPRSTTRSDSPMRCPVCLLEFWRSALKTCRRHTHCRALLSPVLASMHALFYFAFTLVSAPSLVEVGVHMMTQICFAPTRAACCREITFKTDPEKGDYELETGASRNFESWTDKQATEKKHKEARCGSRQC